MGYDNQEKPFLCDLRVEPPPHELAEPYLQRTNCACLRGYTGNGLTGCFCQGATKRPLSPLCAIMLIVDSKPFVPSNECKPIVPSLGPLEANMLLILLLIEKIRSHV